MKKEVEEIVEKVLYAAMENGGEVLFTKIFTSVPKDIKEINMALSLYGDIRNKMLGGSWIRFMINQDGIRFISNGGFEGDRKKKESYELKEKLSLEIDMLQKEKLEYEKKIRHQESMIRLHKYLEAISWIATLILSLIVAFSE